MCPFLEGQFAERIDLAFNGREINDRETPVKGAQLRVARLTKEVVLKIIPVFALAVLVAGCGENGVSTNEAADQLEQAADLSDPAAREVLQDEAAELRNSGDGSVDPSAPDGLVQQALENASNASGQSGR